MTGKLPFDASQPMDYLALQIRGTPIPLGKRIPGLTFPPGLEDVVMKTIAKEPDDRYPSAQRTQLARHRQPDPRPPSGDQRHLTLE